MMRQLLSRGLLTSAIVFGAMGCETTHSFLHHDKDDDSAAKKEHVAEDDTNPTKVTSDSTKIRSVSSNDKDSTPFFRSDRTPSAMSSQAAEIERDLGIQ
jgi:hypothetical protein